ncbi:MAG: hypothetical protein V3V29_00750 [Acidimicrobiia bacterium]
MDENETVESVPWSELLDETEPGDDLRRIAYMVAGLLGAVVLGAVVARAWWSPSPPVIMAPGGDGVVAAAPVDGIDPPVDPPSQTLPLYSEADLMANPPDPGQRAAIVRAEWFVTDFFTADYEPTGSADVRAALPAAVDLPNLPQDGRGGISYVEWARAFRVEEAGQGSYLVGVVFRTLAAPPDGAFIRLAVRAVEVLVEVSGDGASVLDLPRPIALPVGPEPAPWVEPEADPPPDVVDLAAARASVWGSEPRIVSASVAPTGWRVIVTVADDVGNRWPLSMMIDV